MWPTLAELGSVKLTVWGLSLATAFVMGSFVIWRNLKDEFDPEQLLNLWLWVVVGVWAGSGLWACGWLGVCMSSLMSVNTSLISGIGVLAIFCGRKRWNFWELLDVFGPLSLAIAVLTAMGWGPGQWPAALAAAAGLVITIIVRKSYRNWGWYKSGKTGFVGTWAVMWWGVIQMAIANFQGWGVYSLTWFIMAAVVVIYIRSERRLDRDFRFLWPKRKT